MKTTLTLEDDLVAEIESVVKKTGQSFDKLVNNALREGLAKVTSLPIKAKPFRQKTHNMGVYPHVDYTKAMALAEESEDRERVKKMNLGHDPG